MRIIDQWNGLSNSTVTSKSVNAFKSTLNAEDWNPYIFTCSSLYALLLIELSTPVI
jgi:hypothetical protein